MYLEYMFFFTLCMFLSILPKLWHKQCYTFLKYIYMPMPSTQFLNYSFQIEHKLACCCHFKYIQLKILRKKIEFQLQFSISSIVFAYTYYVMAWMLQQQSGTILPTTVKPVQWQMTCDVSCKWPQVSRGLNYHYNSLRPTASFTRLLSCCVSAASWI